MTQKQRYKSVIAWFEANMPQAQTELHYKNAYQLLVAVILSAQCTDKRINMVTPSLFLAFPSPADMARASVEQIFEYIKSVSFPNNKAKNLLGMAQTLVNEHNGEVPDTMEQLVRIPGVGRKTANVILSVVHNKPAMAVDTHVFRVSNRIGLTKNSPNVLETEKTLVANIPQKLLGIAHHWLILHGRYVCTARKPHCENCGIKNACAHFESLNNQ